MIKKRISVKALRHSLVNCKTWLPADSIKEDAEKSNDEVMLRKIHCMDFVAREACTITIAGEIISERQ